MCGRFQQPGFDQLVDFYDAKLGGGFSSVGVRYNVAPTTQVGMLRLEDDGLELAAARWGLVPSWWSSEKPPRSTFNARSETADTKKMFRAAFKRKRCLVPAGGYYEWKKWPDGTKSPHYIHFASGEPLLFYGLWEAWRNPEAEPGDNVLLSCTVLTRDATPDLADLHDRMPCLTAEVDHAWLDPDFTGVSAARGLLEKLPEEPLVATRVSSYVNKVGNEGPECVESAGL